MLKLKKSKNDLKEKGLPTINKKKASLHDVIAVVSEEEKTKRNKSATFYNYANSLYQPKKLTIKQLRKYKGLSKISDAIALEIIDGLYKLSIITYKIHLQNGT